MDKYLVIYSYPDGRPFVVPLRTKKVAMEMYKTYCSLGQLTVCVGKWTLLKGHKPRTKSSRGAKLKIPE